MDFLSQVVAKGDTLPKILKANSETLRDNYAFVEKRGAFWHPVTWGEYFKSVEEIASGLLSLGMKKGDNALIIGDNTLEWYLLELACYFLGAVTIGLPPEADIHFIKSSANRFKVRFIFAQDQEQVDKILQGISEIPSVEKIIYWRYRGLGNYKNPLLLGIKELMRKGEEIRQKEPDLIRKHLDEIKPNDPFTVLFTSGILGAQKPVTHTHEAVIQNVGSYLRIDPWRQTDRIIPFFPPFGLVEKWFSIGCHLISGATLFLPHNFQTYLKDMKEMGPTIIFLPGHAWERIVSRVEERMKRSDALKRFVYRLFMEIRPGETSSHKSKLFRTVGDLLLYRPLKKHLGFSSARLCYNTGPLLNGDVLRFFRTIGTPIKNLYWTTEVGFISISSGMEREAESVGFPLHGIEVSVSSSGEIIIRGNHIFRGYPDYVGDSGLRDGAFFTGDSGYLDPTKGLFLVDRVGDALVSSSGSIISTQILESMIRMDPRIKEAWVFGNGKTRGMCAVLIADDESLRRFAGERGLYLVDPIEITQAKEFLDLVREIMGKVNQILPEEKRISRYLVLPQEFYTEGKTVSYMRRLRKGYLRLEYRELIEGLLNGARSVKVPIPGVKEEIREFPVNFIDEVGR